MTEEELLAHLRSHYSYKPALSMGWGKHPALLVIDLIEGFTSPDSPLGGDWDPQVEATQKLIEISRQHQRPIIFTTVLYNRAEPKTILLTRKTPAIETLQQGSRWVQIDPRLEQRDTDLVIAKQYGSAFFGTSLTSHLVVAAVDTLVLCGCLTSGCGRASAVDAAQYGFRPMVVREATGDRSALAHEANLMDIELRYGDVLTLKEASACLGTPSIASLETQP